MNYPKVLWEGDVDWGPCPEEGACQLPKHARVVAKNADQYFVEGQTTNAMGELMWSVVDERRLPLTANMILFEAVLGLYKQLHP